jgi:hypothetical protein
MDYWAGPGICRGPETRAPAHATARLRAVDAAQPRARPATAIPLACATARRVPPVKEGKAAERRAARSGELKLIGGELSWKTKPTLVISIKPCIDLCRWGGLGWSGRDSLPTMAARRVGGGAPRRR